MTVLVLLIPLIFYLILGYSLWDYLVYALVIAITMGVIYYIRFQTSKTINMKIYILVGAVCLFLIAVFTTTFILVLTKVPPPATFIGDGFVFLLYFIIIPSLGGIIGYLLGKRTDYRIPIGVNYYEKKE